MKKYYLLFAALFLAPGVSFAAVGDNCTMDLASSVNENIDWSQAYVIRGADGSAWQRAILPRTSDVLTLDEGKQTVIQGTGQANAPVQIFIFSAETLESGGIKRPDGPGTCFDAGIGDAQGNFSFPVSPRLLWSSIGQDVVIDAFTQLEQSWDQLKEAPTNQNYFIGTHMPTKRMRVELTNTQQNCPRLCTQSPYTIGTRIRPDMYPEVARTTFPFAKARELNAGGLEGRTGAETTGSNVITIAKLGPQTYYTLAERDQPELAEFLDGLAQKTLLIETVKRVLLGEAEIGTAAPAVSGGLPLTEINEDSLLAALSDTQTAVETKELVQGLHDALTGPANSATRLKGLTAIETAFNSIAPEDKSGYSFPTRKMIEEVFPASRSEASWRADVVDILMLWTEDTKSNTCLMPKENIATNFMTAPATLNALPIPETNCAAAVETTEDIDFKNLPPGDTAEKKRRRAELGLTAHSQKAMALGLDPILVVKEGVKNLEPDFSNITITKINTPFTTPESWDVSGADSIIEYEYTPTADFYPKTVTNACLAQDDLLSYGAYLTKIVGLPDEAADFIELELDQNSPDTEGLLSVQLAHPDSIAKRISWKADGETLDLAQLFFRVKADGCSQVSFDLPTKEIVDLLNTKVANGYEIGILK